MRKKTMQGFVFGDRKALLIHFWERAPPSGGPGEEILIKKVDDCRITKYRIGAFCIPLGENRLPACILGAEKKPGAKKTVDLCCTVGI